MTSVCHSKICFKDFLLSGKVAQVILAEASGRINSVSPLHGTKAGDFLESCLFGFFGKLLIGMLTLG
jgi:hypothetical protein